MMKNEERLLQICQRKRLILAFAESCTGGALSARLTQIPGASKYFAGSIVSYQDLTKIRLLKVSEMLLNKAGAVNKEVAEQMLAGALHQFSADIAAAVTGIAGPSGGTTITPVGSIYIALGGKSFGIRSIHLQLKGTRAQIIQETVDSIFSGLIDLLDANNEIL